VSSHIHLIRTNRNYARRAWGHMSSPSLQALEELTKKYRLSVALGDIQYIEQRWYVTHAGLLRLAERTRCSGIHVRPRYAAVLAVPRKQPLNRLSKLLTDPHQNLRPNLLFAALDIRKVSLTHSNPPRKLLLRHVEASEFPDPSPDILPVERASLTPQIPACVFHVFRHTVCLWISAMGIRHGGLQYPVSPFTFLRGGRATKESKGEQL